MKIEAREFYLSAGGCIVEIRNYDMRNKARDISSNAYEKTGKSIDHNDTFDLIAEIPKELHHYLIQQIRNYHTKQDFKLMVDSGILSNNEVRKVTNDRN